MSLAALAWVNRHAPYGGGPERGAQRTSGRDEQGRAGVSVEAQNFVIKNAPYDGATHKVLYVFANYAGVHGENIKPPGRARLRSLPLDRKRRSEIARLGTEAVKGRPRRRLK